MGVPNSSGPDRAWASSKKAASTQPVPSSTETKTTRLPDFMGGVIVETRTPATHTSVLLRRLSRSAARVSGQSASRPAHPAIRCAETSRLSTSSSVRRVAARSALSRAGWGFSAAPRGRASCSGIARTDVVRRSSLRRISSRRPSAHCPGAATPSNTAGSRAPIAARRSREGRCGRARARRSAAEVYGAPAMIRSISAADSAETWVSGSRIAQSRARPGSACSVFPARSASSALPRCSTR